MKWFKHFTDASDDEFLQTVEDLRLMLCQMIAALDKPVLDYENDK